MKYEHDTENALEGIINGVLIGLAIWFIIIAAVVFLGCDETIRRQVHAELDFKANPPAVSWKIDENGYLLAERIHLENIPSDATRFVVPQQDLLVPLGIINGQPIYTESVVIIDVFGVVLWQWLWAGETIYLLPEDSL